MKKIIVPTDFTEVADNALKYACEMSEYLNSQVHLLHVIKSEKEEEEAIAKMKAQASAYLLKTEHPIENIVIPGNIFDDIPGAAKQHNANLVVMGTHGLQGMQYVVGSNALRIITDSDVPILIVQEGTTKTATVRSILVPLDLHQETKQILKIACDTAEMFKAEIHLISPKENDEFLQNRLARNVAYAEGYLESREIAYKTNTTDSGSGSFIKEVIKYAHYANIDLLCILNFANDRLIHSFGIDAEQKIITNEHNIPVLVINPRITYHNTASILAQ
jgi:nucleotide-binding universal stress UspA family protein